MMLLPESMNKSKKKDVIAYVISINMDNIGMFDKNRPEDNRKDASD